MNSVQNTVDYSKGNRMLKNLIDNKYCKLMRPLTPFAALICTSSNIPKQCRPLNVPLSLRYCVKLLKISISCRWDISERKN